MGTAKIILAAAAATTVLASSAFADDMTGTVTSINRLNNTISIQQTQKGTVGGSAGGAGALQQFKAKDAAMLDAVHAGDRVTYSATDADGAGTLTTLKKQ
ncbi:copper-binding protein [Bradyrhizobium manausense]|uniref:copper-binding protein n=1 Tax=Bradyrhizobium manausense TaxID=989370 RepID=UPI001BAC975F|nr:copper-binding protein [Bradyrhizobium manausense]MBR0686266.1 copper-binding protein [Bradyrhizobium manausense]MBR0722425.1 copper-binding protein [Bradyrhizobium manausense]MBR0833402.1 copper-binding protein [Bradyrhizobium manausense]